MADITLTAREPFDGMRLETEGVTLSGVTGKALVSAAIPNGGEAAFAKSLQAAYGVSLPAPGATALSRNSATLLIGLQRDQIFLMFDRTDDWPERCVSGKLGDATCVTDQSDGWVMARMAGPRCREALERICRLDLHPEAFAEGAVARTLMEHLNVIVWRDGAESFLLMSPRSSASSFLHALETSILNIRQSGASRLLT